MSSENSQPASFSPNGCGCLIILIFLGIISAISIDTGFDRVHKAKSAEGKYYVALMNKYQQDSFITKGTFTNSFETMGISRKTETAWFKYSVKATDRTAFNYAIAKELKIKSYVGGVFVVPGKDKKVTASILCETDSPATIEPAEPTYQNGKVVCGKGTTAVTK